jgi:hypothetical protein
MHTILLPQSRVRRAIESFRHPDQAAIAARLPVAGSRVPMRWYWRRQSPRPRRAARHLASEFRSTRMPRVDAAARRAARATGRLTHDAGQARSKATHAMRRAAANARPAAGAARERTAIAMTDARSRMRRPRMRGSGQLFAIGAVFAAGALAMYYFDANSGRRRRALLRDRFAHWRNVARNELPYRFNKRRRFVRGVARGVRHNVGEIMHPHHVVPDDETLVARVRSETLRDGLAGQVNVDAYEGCVTLRGELESTALIQRLIDRAGNVDGVREVRSYLHLPGTVAPNIAEVYEKERLPARLAAGGDQGIGLVN